MSRVVVIAVMAWVSGTVAPAVAEVHRDDDGWGWRDPDGYRDDHYRYRDHLRVDLDHRPTPVTRDELAARLDQESPGACLDAALGRHRASLRVRLAPGRRPLVVVRVLPASAPIERCLRAVGQTVVSGFEGRALERTVAVRRAFDGVGARPEAPERDRAPAP